MSKNTKEKVLTYILQHNGQFVSGQAMAADLSLSRTAIWKAIDQLREKGYHIEARTGNGYCLKSLPEKIDPQLIQYLLSPKEIAIRYEYEVTSTNDLLKDNIKTPLNVPQLLIAEKQTAGRGRRGRQFYSNLERGLYFSLAIKPKTTNIADIPLYTILTASALHDTLSHYVDPSELKIKWVNDIFYKGHKVSGILSELQANIENQEATSLIIGIGINLLGDFSKAGLEVEQVAGTLFDKETIQKFNANLFLKEFLQTFFNHEINFEDKPFISSYKSSLLGIDKTIFYERQGKKYKAIIKGINHNGHLIVQNMEGKEEILYGEEIHIGSDQLNKRG